MTPVEVEVRPLEEKVHQAAPGSHDPGASAVIVFGGGGLDVARWRLDSHPPPTVKTSKSMVSMNFNFCAQGHRRHVCSTVCLPMPRFRFDIFVGTLGFVKFV